MLSYQVVTSPFVEVFKQMLGNCSLGFPHRVGGWTLMSY